MIKNYQSHIKKFLQRKILINKIEVGRYYEREGRIIKIISEDSNTSIRYREGDYIIHRSKQDLLETCNKLKISTIDFLRMKR